MDPNSSFSEKDLDLESAIAENEMNTTFNHTELIVQYFVQPIFEIIVHGLLVTIIGCAGILGNISCLIVLFKPCMKNNINCLLIGLCFVDMSLIISALILFSTPAIQIYLEVDSGSIWIHFYPLVTPIMYPIAMISQTSSVYLTMIITIERYLVVCWPLRSRSLCTYGRAKRCVFMVFLFAILYNLTRFFEFSHKKTYDEDGNYMFSLIATDLRENHMYISLYMNWLYMIVMYAFPFLVMFVLNWKIAREIQKAKQERFRMSNSEKKEQSVAIMLMVVVTIFMICNAPAMASNIAEHLRYDALELTQISNFLVVLNSSVNVMVYLTFGMKFRRVFCKVFCCKEDTHEEIRVSFGRSVRGAPHRASSQMKRGPREAGSIEVGHEKTLPAPKRQSPKTIYKSHLTLTKTFSLESEKNFSLGSRERFGSDMP
ncbi:hypothetical protein TCAL_02110 [Tigriopus californicus]|uniref:G-protein coupled receptors family 1 profile domain-containing protein n=1 Tax=Tigriopus californicus TaxID=6832 RepID=A0A553N9S8_TIGCA|nr:FMRFamide receptor-like [Tigriopus californicus]TRY62194.1 hypothetical protein TCAL_02110 [Tigriopus californicus]|eukprot:TCALIF_02110-PA protein Name:"Similar to FR FMRFamide receptor (Drosophila melanogaster)" AED:0.03 eAED:0.03 QI:0/-1/0/1/-1/1/1/0/428